MSLFPILVALAVTLTTTFMLCRLGQSWMLDHPNDRSLHVIPKARTGGLGIWAGLISGGLLAPPIDHFAWIAAASIFVAMVSLRDDVSHVPVFIRLTVHALAASAVVIALKTGRANTDITLAQPAWPMAGILFCVWMTNLYNFMDGMDGLAGGMAVFGFGTLGFLGHLAGDDSFAMLNWVIATAAAGFLLWNFPPARIFMGDTGSATLGFLAAALSLKADIDGLFPLWLSLLVFAPFVVDATVTIIRRLLKGERIWEAHRSHYYQRLVQAGWTHRRTALLEYALMALCSASAIVIFRASAVIQTGVLASIGALLIVSICAVYHVESACRRKT